MIKWIGGNDSPELERTIDELKKKHEELDQEEKLIDKAIADLNE
jgi:hypothetical protein